MSIRLFAAIPVPEDFHTRLLSLQKGVPGARWRPAANFHVTLRFFGEISETTADDLDAELANIIMPTFDLRLKGAGWYGRNEPYALWMGVDAPEALQDLQQRCERAARRAGLAPEPRHFSPHMTIAYLRETPLVAANAFATRHALFETEAFRVTHFSLCSSWSRQGGSNLYRAEADYPLG
jgi:2'-5' RNA ligase